MTLTAYVYPKIQTVKDLARQMSKNSGFRGPFDMRHCKRTEALLKDKDPHPCHI